MEALAACLVAASMLLAAPQAFAQGNSVPADFDVVPITITAGRSLLQPFESAGQPASAGHAIQTLLWRITRLLGPMVG